MHNATINIAKYKYHGSIYTSIGEFRMNNYIPLGSNNYNGSQWTTLPSTGNNGISTINTTPYQISNPHFTTTVEDYFFANNTKDMAGANEIKYINSILKEYFDEFNVDIEEVTMKELFDYIIKKDALLIKYVPQTVERCKLALSTEWSKKVKDAIQLPFSGELYRFYLKMKLTHGPLQ